jgi:hypothetical protein
MDGRGTRTFAAGALIAVLAAGGALATIDPGDYRVKQKDQSLPAETPVTVKVRCPKRHRAVPAGGFVHAPGERGPDPALAVNASVSSSAPVGTGKAWRIAAEMGAGDELRVHLTALCAPRGQLRGAEVVRKRFELGTSVAGGGAAKCPRNMRVATGGVLWHEPGSRAPVSTDLRTSSSAPTKRARGWYGNGYHFHPGSLVLDVVAVCLPKGQLDDLERVAETLTPPNSTGQGARVRCPGGSRVLTGGALWHAPGSPPDPAIGATTLLSSSAPSKNARSWYADGANFYAPPDTQLTVVALCTPA